jgi:CRP-like cAMP-binding protein
MEYSVSEIWEPGQYLFHQGDPVDRAFIIEKGRINIQCLLSDGREVLLWVEGTRDICGFDAIIEGSQYTVSARAIQTTRVRMWNINTIRRLMLQYPQLTLNAYKAVVNVLDVYTKRMLLFTTESVEERIRGTLAYLTAHVGRRSGDAIWVDVAEQDLADLSGTTIFTVSRVLRDWQKCGAIEKRRGKIKVLDLVLGPQGDIALSIAND